MKGRKPKPGEKCADCGQDPGMLIYPTPQDRKRMVCFPCWKDRESCER